MERLTLVFASKMSKNSKSFSKNFYNVELLLQHDFVKARQGGKVFHVKGVKNSEIGHSKTSEKKCKYNKHIFLKFFRPH